jgi:RimJ/RimL family protein N-acetyltransferase
VILTPRLRLRALTTRDLALFRALYCNAETMRYIGKPFSRTQAARSLRLTVAATRKPPRSLRHYVIAERKSRRSVGMCSLRPAAWAKRGAEAGLMLLPAASGRGYAREALQSLIDAALLKLRVDTVWVQHDPANASAARLSHALGFRPVRKKSLLDECRGQMLQLLKRPRSHIPTTSEGK